MPRITQGNANEHLFSAVKRFNKQKKLTIKRFMWDRKLDFHNVKSCYSKDTLVRLLRRNQDYEDDYSMSTLHTSPNRDRSPCTSHILSSTPIHDRIISAVPSVEDKRRRN